MTHLKTLGNGNFIPGLIDFERYESFIGTDAVARLYAKARELRDASIMHVNSTFYGGGVAELLESVTMLFNSLDIRCDWRTIKGSPDFFTVTKKMHNALQGGTINWTPLKAEIYEQVLYENAVRMRLDYDFVVAHDPQALGLIRYFRKKNPWIWRCHVDLSDPHKELWRYLRQFLHRYDSVILSSESYKRRLRASQHIFLPAIDPFAVKNRELSEEEIDERLAHYKIPTDLPLVVQVSRFDRWKDPEGVVKAVNLARKEINCTLVLLGNVATDDPEGQEVYDSLLELRDERTILLLQQDSALVNALQRRAAVVMQKSIREGFGLTVSEAMWKGTPVIGGNVGGIRFQIDDGKNGFLVNSVEEAAARLVTLLKNPGLCEKMGREGREKVRKNFLLPRLLEQYLDLFRSYEPDWKRRKFTGV